MMCSFKILDILRKKYKRIDVNNFTDLRVEDDTFSIYYDDETRQAKQGCQKLYMDDRDS
jgi:hypothetical protein